MITGEIITLRAKTLNDAQDDYSWQTDSELARLDAMPSLMVEYSQYIFAYAEELPRVSSSRRQFAIDTLDGKHIGNCTYYGIDKDKGKAELGIMIGNRDYWDKGYGTDAVRTLVSYIFQQPIFKRIHLKTLVSNRRAQECFKQCGFTQYGRHAFNGYSFVLMEIHRKQWEKQRRL